MRWPRWWRTERHQEDLCKDQLARQRQERQLAEAEDRWPEVHRLASELRRQRKANQFSERIMRAVRGEGP